MLNKCDEVEEGQFKKNFQKYSMATVCGGRMSHIAHCRSEICQKMKHSYYEGLGGLILETNSILCCYRLGQVVWGI